jgi:hypothetical protein
MAVLAVVIYLTTSTLYNYLVSGNLSNTVITDTLYMNAAQSNYLRTAATALTLYSSNILVLAASSNTILRAGGVENLYMNSTGIPYCFSANPPSHESHIITKKYLEQETANTKTYVDSETVITKQYVDNETNKCAKISSTNVYTGQTNNFAGLNFIASSSQSFTVSSQTSTIQSTNFNVQSGTTTFSGSNVIF